MWVSVVHARSGRVMCGRQSARALCLPGGTAGRAFYAQTAPRAHLIRRTAQTESNGPFGAIYREG